MNTKHIIKEVYAAVKSSPTTYPENLPKGIELKSFSQSKFVTKPWGFELWLCDATDMPFALKLIHLKAGSKTSLQYHEKKMECNCLLSGTAVLHYQDATTSQIQTVSLAAGEVIRVWPPAVHRVEAITDVLLVEASTSELDDVIRLADDYKRPDGKIEAEHQAGI